MRNLTVIRRKAYAGCLVKVKIYIEDPNGDTEINGTKCRLLGKLKNNERATYEISNESLKLFAIYDKLSKGYCNDFYQIPEGDVDYYVSGICKLNPFIGNPFLFDGVNEEQALANRSKNNKKAIAIMLPVLIIAVVAGFLIGWFLL